MKNSAQSKQICEISQKCIKFIKLEYFKKNQRNLNLVYVQISCKIKFLL